MTGSGGLFALFQSEMALHVPALERRLLALAEEGRPPARDRELVQAATSIRGAARVVGVEVAERLLDAMEACLDSRGALGGERLEALLDAAALLAGIGSSSDDTAAAGRSADVDLACLRLEALSGGAPAESAEAAARGGITLELFRLECETHAATLSDGLLLLEREPHRTELFERLMRAAHSLKGAARVVGLESAVTLAHAIEDLLTSARRERAELPAGTIGLLLEATDVLARIGQAGAVFDSQPVTSMASRIRALVAGEAAVPMRAAQARTPRPSAAGPSETEGRGSPSPPADGGAVVDERDRVLRVKASHISRLVGLTGEALVESRQLEPLSRAQHRLRARQAALSDLVNDLHQALGAPPADDPVGVRVAELRTRITECRSLLNHWEEEFETHARRSEELTLRLHKEATASRMRPLADGLTAFPRMVRDLAHRLGKRVDLVIAGDDLSIDRDILEKAEAPLNHIVRNAVDHGIETPEERARTGKPERGSIRIEAHHRAGTLTIDVSDDGRGIDPARIRERVAELGLLPAGDALRVEDGRLLDYLFAPGFSTADAVTEISGRGVGLDVVQNVLHEVGGSVHASSELGRGTSIHLTLPVSRSVIRAVVVSIAGEPYAFPLARIDRLIEAPFEEARIVENRQYLLVDGRSVALIPAAQVLELDGGAEVGDVLSVVVASDRAHRLGFVVERFLGEHDLVVRPLDPRLGRVSDISAAAILPDGSPLLIIDVDDMIRSVMRLQQVTRIETIARREGSAERKTRRILVVDDSITVRELERQLLGDLGYEVETAVDGTAAWSAVRDGPFDLVITDIDMPRMDGITLTRSIKQDTRLRRLPVIIVSYRDAAADRARGLEAGADAYLAKRDFGDDLFVETVRGLIGGPRSSS